MTEQFTFVFWNSSQNSNITRQFDRSCKIVKETFGTLYANMLLMDDFEKPYVVDKILVKFHSSELIIKLKEIVIQR